jgi:F0F1-type ATP synthase assembly protein I
VNNPDKNQKLMSLKEVAFMATQIGFSVAITSVIFVCGGKYLDTYTGKSPLFTLLGIILGLAASLYLVWQIVKPLQRKYKADYKALKKQPHQD